MSSIAHSVNEAAQWLHKHAPDKQKLVKVEVLKKSEEIVRDAADTVATSFMLYQLIAVIAYEPNVNIRCHSVSQLKGQLTHKSVAIGKDTLEFMDKVTSNKFEVLTRAKSD